MDNITFCILLKKFPTPYFRDYLAFSHYLLTMTKVVPIFSTLHGNCGLLVDSDDLQGHRPNAAYMRDATDLHPFLFPLLNSSFLFPTSNI